ncbi:PREDICTED: uncharacterized protein LOC107192315 [Dufourea novaeangliae]|uniref:uncharacterized protein LOC107192315 n=1 Tax=Dufourea novaeangliae TaxID=178035 RepID=UPI0007671EC7|nr:PREDICTED: uncharacterized protein LOC107192315 [Dufourea novaeangliae]
MIQSNHYTSQSKLIEKFSCEQKVTECILDEYIVQNEIKYTSYTLLLFNNHELYRYFNTQQFKNTCNSLIKYSEGKNLEHSNGKLISSRDNNKRTSTFQLKNSIQKRIITSSPEYQKFLANLKSRILCPCIFEISASYVIRIKSI